MINDNLEKARIRAINGNFASTGFYLDQAQKYADENRLTSNVNKEEIMNKAYTVATYNCLRKAQELAEARNVFCSAEYLAYATSYARIAQVDISNEIENVENMLKRSNLKF